MKVFVILLSPCFVFLQKLILPGFLLLFEGYHENLHKISDPLVPLTPLGMVCSPSYGPSKGWVALRDRRFMGGLLFVKVAWMGSERHAHCTAGREESPPTKGGRIN